MLAGMFVAEVSCSCRIVLNYARRIKLQVQLRRIVYCNTIEPKQHQFWDKAVDKLRKLA